MPVEFLSEEQERHYGHFAGEPSPAQLARYFFLDDTDRTFTNQRRGSHTRLGFALQLGTVRFLGTFLTPGELAEVPVAVISHVAAQLGITDSPGNLQRYLERETTAREHSLEIQQRYGYRSFSDQPWHFRLVRWLYARTWLGSERPSLLFDLTTGWLAERKILLPGVSILARLVAAVRDRSSSRLWHALSKALDKEQRARLEALLVLPLPAQNDSTHTYRPTKHERQTPLDRLRNSPVNISSNGLLKALERLAEVRAVGVNTINLSWVPPNQLKVLARYAALARAQALSRMGDERRIASLLAFVVVLEATSQDDALDLLDQLTSSLLARAVKSGQKDRLYTLPELDEAALKLGEACQVLVDPAVADLLVREKAYSRIPLPDILAAIALVQHLARPAQDKDNYYQELLKRYVTVRRFWPKLVSTITFSGVQAGQPVLDALAFLRKLETNRPSAPAPNGNGNSQTNPEQNQEPPQEQAAVLEQQPEPQPQPDLDKPQSQTETQTQVQEQLRMAEAPREVVNRAWQALVFQKHHQPHDRRFYTFCVLQRLQDNLQRRDIFVSPSERYADPRIKLLQGEAWQAARALVCRSLNRSEDPKVELETWTSQLDEAYLRTAANIPLNSGVRITQHNGQDRVVLTQLEKLPESASLVSLKNSVAAMLPRVDLAEAVLEIQSRTGFASEFTHISEANARVEDLELSICAVLVAEACNIGLEPLINQQLPALTRSRLAWVQQNYIRADTITRANARLVEAQSKLALAQAWGGGEVASADGLRFSVPIKTLNAGPNSKYFGSGRGVTFYNFLSNQFSGIHALVIPGTLRDAPYLLEGVLEQQTILAPSEIMSDTSGYSDIIFGLFFLLGYQFSPRLADVGGTRYWRMNNATHYGLLEGVARHQLNTKLIERNWEDVLRVTGSLKMGTVKATELIRVLQAGGRTSTLGRAIGEVGRIAKSLFLLGYLDDENYRRRILTQLNRGETRHTLARAIFHGKRGELRQRYREGQEDQLGALGLLLNVCVLWNTQYMDLSVKGLKSPDQEIKPEDIGRLSPLGYEHINMLGRYQFTLPEGLKTGAFRELRKPDIVE